MLRTVSNTFWAPSSRAQKSSVCRCMEKVRKNEYKAKKTKDMDICLCTLYARTYVRRHTYVRTQAYTLDEQIFFYGEKIVRDFGFEKWK